MERAAGVPLDEFVRKGITAPLGMKDTHFYLPREKRARLAAVHTVRADSQLTRAPDGPRGPGDYVAGPGRSFSGGAGLVSTARDYARFLQMLLNGGTLGGARILAPKTVALMTTNQTDTLYSRGGEGFGLGFETLERAGAGGRMESVGTFGWSGAYGSMYEVDPAERLVLVLMLQNLPSRTGIDRRFPVLVYRALVEPHR